MNARKLALLLLVIAGFLAYEDSFDAPFTLDDTASVIENRTIRHLWPPWRSLSPPPYTGVGGRPVVNFSLAVNYALGGTSVQGYHLLNLAIHILAALTLFGLVRRTLLQPLLRNRFGAMATVLALATAAIWELHPVLTEAVTYVSERSESMMGLFYLLTLYGFIRGVESAKPGHWYMLSVVACLLGMATKEVMVTAPLTVLLYDRTFVARSFRAAWTQRWRLYAGLAATWLLLGYLMTGVTQRGVGYDLGFGWQKYALTECRVVVNYLRLALWPHPLVFDYGMAMNIQHAAAAAPYALILALLAAVVVVGLTRRTAIGFLGAWFFLILAPSSSVVPVANQPMAESRLYLPLAAVAALVVPGLYAWIGRRSLPMFVVLALALGWMTFQRNEDYHSSLTLWSDAVRKLPDNIRAYANVGSALFQEGRVPEAIAVYDRALRIDPDSVDAHTDLAIALVESGKVEDGARHFQKAMQIKPRWAATHYNLATALARAGHSKEAIAQYQEALRLTPNYPSAHYNLAEILVTLGRIPEAIDQYQQVLRYAPDYFEACSHLGSVLARSGKFEEAITQYREALRLEPENAEAHLNLGAALAKLGRLEPAIQQYEDALRVQPDYVPAHNSLANALVRTGQFQEAIEHYQQALQGAPNSVEIHYNLAIALERAGHTPEAIEQYRQALKLRPDLTAAQNALSRLQSGP